MLWRGNDTLQYIRFFFANPAMFRNTISPSTPN